MGFLIIILVGAGIGFVLSKKGHEREGAISGAKAAGGCLLAITIGAIIAFIIIVIALSSVL